MTEPGPERRPTTLRDLAAMPTAMTAAVLFLMVWADFERRLLGDSLRTPTHYVSLAAGVLLSVALYTAVIRMLTGPRR